MQAVTDHWVLSRLFVILEEIRNIELSMERVEKQVRGLKEKNLQTYLATEAQIKLIVGLKQRETHKDKTTGSVFKIVK